VNAASSPRGLVWNQGVDLLCATMRRWPQTSVAIADMLKSRRANVLFNAICCITDAMPKETAMQMIIDGLSDKSGRVRGKAAQTAQDLTIVDAVPHIEKALEREQDKKVRKSIEFPLALLRDGYQVRQHGTEYTIAVPVSHGISSKFVSKEDLTPDGIARVIRELQERDAHDWADDDK
jgi:hypothetical protein